ncbi:hypothetical protein LJC48_01570 [Desulfovibrio sp. OttesenSCG-928-C06]|nr:hypothetical protein [Desulfovibrio sp. OttesenSCG-928-C06]
MSGKLARFLPLLAILALFLCLPSCSEEKAMFNGGWVLSKLNGDIPAEHPLEWCGLVIDMQGGVLRIYSSYYNAYGELEGGVQSGRVSRIANGGKTAEFALRHKDNGELKTVRVNYADGTVTLDGEPEFRYQPGDFGDSLERLGHTWILDADAGAGSAQSASFLPDAWVMLEFDVVACNLILTLPSYDKKSYPFWITGYADGKISISIPGVAESAVLEFGPRNTMRMGNELASIMLKRGR